MRKRLLPILSSALLIAGLGSSLETKGQCNVPTSLSSVAVSSTSSDLSWTSGGASNWNIEYGPEGFTQGNGTYITTNSNPHTLSNLSANVAYEFYVRDSCGPANLSTWAGPLDIDLDVVPCDSMEPYQLGLVGNQSLLIKGWAGSGGDGAFTDVQASSGTQSLHIADTGTNGYADIVAEIGTYTTGIHNVKFDFYVPTTYGGYYNILHNYTGATNVWAIEVTLDANGSATVVEGTNGIGTIGTYQFNTGAWNTVEHIIDLDNDTAFIKVNGNYTDVGWQFSLGSTNFGDQFNAVNFYSTANTGQTPVTYFDDLCVMDAQTNDVGIVEILGPTPLCGDSNYPLQVVVKNFAENVPSTFGIDVDITGTFTSSLNMNYAGPLLPGTMDTVTLGYVNNSAGGTFNIEAYSDLFNDTILNNDSTNYYNIPVLENPNIYLGPDIDFCSNTNFNETLMAGTVTDTILWSTQDTTTSISITTQGTYTVQVTNTFGCVDMDTVVVTQYNPVTVNLGPDIEYCEGEGQGPYTLDAGFFQGADYLWSVTSTTQTISTSFPGTYRVTVTTDDVCDASDTIRIIEHDLPEINLTDTTVCGGDTVYFDAGNAGSDYEWNQAGFDQQVYPATETGSYAVTVTTPVGCENSDTADLTVNPTPLVALGDDTTIYQGDDITLDAGNAGATYNWSNGETTQTITIDESGTYAVTVTSSEGCEGMDEIVVDVVIGIDENDGSELSFYPNPTDGQLNVSIKNTDGGLYDFNLYGINGNLIDRYQRNINQTGTVESFDLNNLPSGMYYMNVSNKGSVIAILKVTKM